jgi:multiple antibiotic resistance protein
VRGVDTFSAGIALFLVLDPIGNIPFFLSVLGRVPPANRQRVLLRELFIAYATLVAFLFVGRYFVDFLRLKQESISIAGGIILFLIALRMVFPDHAAESSDSRQTEPFVVPLAIPGVAGPSALAMLLLLAHSQPDRQLQWLAALTCAWGVTALVLLASPIFYRLLKESGLAAMERLMGMILVAMSVQMFLDGLNVAMHHAR